MAGDVRANEQLGLSAMHTVWLREHNRVADRLAELNPQWHGEELYQEARRVVAAQIQHITYQHWLPLVLGPEGMARMGPYRGYDPAVDPSIANAFATAAFRFGHTMVRDMYDILDANGIVVGSFNLSSTFFDPSVIANGITEHARTMVAMRSETFDTFFARSLHEQLFTTNHLFGLDLLALNV